MHREVTNTNESYFSWDTFLMGGFSLIFAICSWAFMSKTTAVDTVAGLAFGMAFLINYPHFMSSYLFLYGDFREMIFKSKRYMWAAIVAPSIIAGVLGYGLLQQNMSLMSYVVSSMFFLVGWHYVKQIFGCVIVTSAQRKIFYAPWERKLLLTNLTSLWLMSWLGFNTATNQYDFMGIPYHGIGLPFGIYQASKWSVGASLVGVLAMHVRKYVIEGKTPSPPGVMAFASIYSWYIPTFTHPGYAYLIPMFHSLQYMPFVLRLKGNKTKSESEQMNPVGQRAYWVKRFGGFFAIAAVLGYLAFDAIPNMLDARGIIPANTMGITPFVATFMLFINIHHYFIDNAIWRSDNPKVKKFLFQAPRPVSEIATVTPLVPSYAASVVETPSVARPAA